MIYYIKMRYGGDSIYSALVVSATEKFCAALPRDTFSPVDTADTTSRAREIARERTYDLLFINAGANDCDARRLAEDASDYGAVVLLLLPDDGYVAARDALRPHGVLTLKKPASLSTILQAADFMCAIAERQRRISKTTAKSEEKIEDMKLINRAKWLLIDNLKMTEADAHRYIERQAMDRCITKRSVAESIIKTYKSI